jgi:ribosome recycling factor
MHTVLAERKPDFESVIDHLNHGLAQLRTGRATPAIVEDIMVDAYDSKMALKGVASISVADARSLVIEPWDKALAKQIEKAIQESDIGINPIADGVTIRVVMPEMTEENRKNLVKIVKEKLEEARIGIRSIREKTREQILKMEKDKEISEDGKFKLLEEADKLTKDYNISIDQIGEKKEEEIMTI